MIRGVRILATIAALAGGAAGCGWMAESVGESVGESVKAAVREAAPDRGEEAAAEPSEEYIDDEVAEERIEQALQRSGESFASVRVSVSDGRATLRGEVPNEADRRQAENIVRSIERIRAVENRLTVAGEETRASSE